MTPASVDLWYVALQVDAATLARCEALLDASESARAARMVFAHHRRRYAVCHAAARLLVARATGLAPQALHWAAGPLGRPWVPDSALAVSFSRSHEWALVATLCDTSGAPGARIGADIEADIGPAPDPAWLADHVSAEALARAVPAPADDAASRSWFFAGWTRVEALAKARGTGIAGAVPTRWDPWQAEPALELVDDEARLRQWFVWPLPARALPTGGAVTYHAALVADRPISGVTIHQLEPAALGAWLATATTQKANAA